MLVLAPSKPPLQLPSYHPRLPRFPALFYGLKNSLLGYDRPFFMGCKNFPRPPMARVGLRSYWQPEAVLLGSAYQPSGIANDLHDDICLP